MEIPELQLTPVPVEPREVRGADDHEDPPGQLLLGGPFWTPLPESPDDDAETRAFRADPAWRWVLGVLALSLQVDEARPGRFERAWVQLDLTRADGAGPEPVAWSMKPDRVAAAVKRSTQLSLGPKLTIADVGVEASVERGTERTLQDVSLEALNEKTAKPRWVLKRTGSAELSGTTRLALVVRAPAGVPVQARIDAGFVTAARKLVFLWPKTEHNQDAQVSVIP